MPTIDVLRSIFNEPKYPLALRRRSSQAARPSALTESPLVQLFELGIGAPEVAARRRDVPMSGKALCRGHVHLRRPCGDRGVPEPVRRHAFGKAGALRRLSHDRLGHLDAHAVRAALFLAPGDEEGGVLVLPTPEVALEPLAGTHPEEHAAIAAALAEHRQFVGDPN